jgi:N utilization substance protein A
VRHKGVLDGFEVSRKEAEDMIMSARVLAGWISAEDLAPPPSEESEAGEGDAADDAAAAEKTS